MIASPSLHLVPVTLAHAPVLAALHGQCFAEPWGETVMARLVPLPGTGGCVACAGEAPLGFALWRIAADEGEILSLGVLPDHRGRGVGARLVAAAQAAVPWCLFLEVATDNDAARALYQRAGFETAGRRPRYYADGRDALVLRWCRP